MACMLRFGERVPEIEEYFRANGFQIHLVKRKDEADAQRFNITIYDSEDFEACRRELERFVSKHGHALKSADSRRATPIFKEVDFRIFLDNHFMVQSFRFSPEILATLADHHLELSLWSPTERGYATVRDWTSKLDR